MLSGLRGGHDEQSQGRSKGDKKLVCLAVEIRQDEKMGRASGTIINDYSSAELGKIFDTHISKEKARYEQPNGQDMALWNQTIQWKE